MYHRSYKEDLLGDSETNQVPNTLPCPTVPNHLLASLPANSSVLPLHSQEVVADPNPRTLGSSLLKASQSTWKGKGWRCPAQGQAPFQQYKIY